MPTSSDVGWPICNTLVVLASEVSGALTYFAPIQPVLGLASVALLAYALRSTVFVRKPLDPQRLPRLARGAATVWVAQA